MDKIYKIFNEVQTTSANHQRCVQQLKTVYKNNEPSQFLETFQQCLFCAFVSESKENNVYVVRTLDFAALFCTTVHQQNNHAVDSNTVEVSFIEEIGDVLQKLHPCKIHAVRYRCCLFIEKLLTAMADLEVSESFCEKVTHILLKRVIDVKHFVRYAAVSALKFLQEPENFDCLVTEALLDRLGDSNAKVRGIVLNCINPRKDILETIIKFGRDVDASVRLELYKRLLRIPINRFKIIHRQEIVENIIAENSPKVLDFINNKLIPFILETYDGDMIKFLNAILLDHSDEVCEKSVQLMEDISKLIFKTRPFKETVKMLNLNEHRLIHLDEITWERTLYWKIAVSYLCTIKDQEEEIFEELAPKLVNLGVFICQYASMADNFSTELKYAHFKVILKQLLDVALLCDVSDEANRDAAKRLVRNLMQAHTLTEKHVYTLMEIVDKVLPNDDKKIEFIADIVTSILYPISEEKIVLQKSKETEISNMEKSISAMNNEIKTAVEQQDFDRADKLKSDMISLQDSVSSTKKAMDDIVVTEEKNDPDTLCKCLDILADLVQFLPPFVNNFPARLLHFKEKFVPELLMHDSSEVRSRALKCFGLFCFDDLKTVKQNLPVFCAPIIIYMQNECDAESTIQSIKIITDLFTKYGSNLIDNPEEMRLSSESNNEQTISIFNGGVSLTEIVQALVDMMMKDENPKVRFAAGFGLTNLLCTRRITSPSVFSRIILKWCNPCIEEEDKSLRARIGKLLEFMSSKGDKIFADQLLTTYIIVMKVLSNAPKTSPYTDVNIDDVSKMLVQMYKNCFKDNNGDYDFVIEVLNEIICRPEDKSVMILSKSILSFKCTNQDQHLITQILELCNAACNIIKSKMALRNIIKYETMLQKLSVSDLSIKEDEAEENEQQQSVQNET